MHCSEAIAYFIVRVILGVLLIAQGYDKIFKIGLNGVVQTFSDQMRSKKVPGFLITVATYFTSYIEFFGGILLILGIGKSFVLPLIGLDLILVSAAFSIITPVWNMENVFPRLALLITLLLMPLCWDWFSLDYLFCG